MPVKHHESPLTAERGQSTQQDRTIPPDQERSPASRVRLVHMHVRRFHQALESSLVEKAGRPTLSARGQQLEISCIGHALIAEALREPQVAQYLDPISDSARLARRGVGHAG